MVNEEVERAKVMFNSEFAAAAKAQGENALLRMMLESKDNEIAFLRARLETLEGTLVEVASPGAHARVHFRPPERTPSEPKTPVGRSPRDLARTHADVPTMTPEELEQLRTTPLPASVANAIAATPPKAEAPK